MAQVEAAVASADLLSRFENLFSISAKFVKQSEVPTLTIQLQQLLAQIPKVSLRQFDDTMPKKKRKSHTSDDPIVARLQLEEDEWDEDYDSLEGFLVE
jgi:hypothetical protein